MFSFHLKSYFCSSDMWNVSLLLSHVEKGLDDKDMGISKLTPQPQKETIAANILHSILRSIKNQAMKFDPLFLKHHAQNVVEKLFFYLFLKNQNWTYHQINSLKFYTVCFYCMPCWGLSKYFETKLHAPCVYHK